MSLSRMLLVPTLLIGLAAAPAVAQDGRARPRNPGTAREWSGGPSPGGDRAGRPEGRPQGGRGNDGWVNRGRAVAPPQVRRSPDAPRGYHPAAPAYRGDPHRDDRADGRRDRTSREYRYRRADAVGRAVPRPYAYTSPRYVPPPGYVRPGWRGGWDTRRWSYYHPSRGWYDPYRRGWYGTRVFVAPRFISPRIVTMLRYEPYYYRPSLGLGVLYGSGGLAPFGAVPPVYYNPSSAYGLGGVRITDAPRDAQVFVDGAYAGIVDDFDGVFQHINLPAGQHRIEIHHPNFQAVAFDVYVEPGRTMTLRADW